MALSSGDNPKAGQTAVTTVAVSLAANQPCSSVVVQNDPASTNNVLVGDSVNQFLAVKPGQALTVPCGNVNQLYVKTATGTATANWISVQ